MASDFERCKRHVAGREITVTSWFDGSTNTWSAGAPAYAHLLRAGDDEPCGLTTRDLAVERVVRVLTSQLKAPP